MSPKESLEQSIEHFRELQNDLIEQISNICQNPREKIISNNYDDLLNEKAKWYLDYKQVSLEPENSIDSLTELKSQDKLSAKDYVKLIETNPEKKITVIRDFLVSLPEIDQNDIEIIIANLAGLSLEDLRNEFQNLEQVFTS